MKQKKLSIILIFILIFSSIIISLSSSVNAEIGDIIIVNWDDIPIGNTSHSNDIMTFETVSNNIVTNAGTDYSLPNTLYLAGASNVAICYINLTSSYDANHISLWFENRHGNGDAYTYFYFNDSVLGDVIKLRYYNKNSNQNDLLQFYESDGSWNTFASWPYSLYKIGWINVTYTGILNLMNYSFSDTGQYLEGASAVTDNWNDCNIDRIQIDAHQYAKCYIDDIIINQNTYQQENNCVINGVILTINGVYDGLVDIEQGEPTLFNFLKHSSSTCAEYGIEITDSENHVVYSKVTYLTSWWFYKSFHSAGEYTLHIWDILNSDGYDVYGNFTVYNSTRINSYVDYGNMFAEIYTDGNDCYYDTLDSPSIIYAVNDSLLKPGCEYYIADIVDNSGKLFQSVYLRNTSGVIKIQDLNTKSFKYADLYHINLYNTTLINDNYIRDSLIYVSRQVEVCDEDGSGSSSLDDDEEIFGVPGSLLFTMVGLIIVFMGFIFPSIIEHNMNAKGHRVNIPREVNVFSGLIAIIGCVMMGFFTLWIIFMFALSMLVFIIMKAKKYI